MSEQHWYDPDWSKGKKTITGALIGLLTAVLPAFGVDLPIETVQALGSLGAFLIVVGIAGKIDRK